MKTKISKKSETKKVADKKPKISGSCKAKEVVNRKSEKQERVTRILNILDNISSAAQEIESHIDQLGNFVKEGGLINYSKTDFEQLMLDVGNLNEGINEYWDTTYEVFLNCLYGYGEDE